jgi:hypothetical protein
MPRSPDKSHMRTAFDEVERLKAALNSLFYKMEEIEPFDDNEMYADRYVPAKHIISDAADSLLAAIDLLRPKK